MSARQTLGQLIRRERLNAGIHLRMLARWMNITPSYLCDIEHDRRTPANPLLRDICRTVGLSYEQAFDRSGKCVVCGGTGKKQPNTKEPAE